MNKSTHQRARELLALAASQPVAAHQSSSDLGQSWLQSHLRECEACRDYAEAVSRILVALHSNPVVADFSLVQATRLRVRNRAVELQLQQHRTWLVCMACTLVGSSAAITTPLLWRGLAWICLRQGLSNWVWQSGFTLFWIVPALVVSALLLAHGTHLTSNDEGREV